MSIVAHFIHHCAIERLVVTGQDAYNNDVAQPTTLAVDVPCRLVTKAQRIVSDDRAQLVTVTTYKLLMPAGADVRESDRIAALTLEDGTNAGAFKVLAILPRRSRAVHHITLELEKVS